MRTIAAVISLTLAACSGDQAAGKSEPRGNGESVELATTGDVNKLTASELRKGMSEGADGDAAAAFRVARHFFRAESGTGKFEQWNLIAAENGHPIAMENVATALWSSGDEFACARAIYWLRRLQSTNTQAGSGDTMEAEKLISRVQRDMQEPGGKCDASSGGGYFFRGG